MAQEYIIIGAATFLFYLFVDSYLFYTGINFLKLLEDNYRINKKRALTFTYTVMALDFFWIIGWLGVPMIYNRV